MSQQKRPESIEDYKKWLLEVHNVKITNQTENYYNSVVNAVKVGFEKSDFWKKLTTNLKEYNDQYAIKTKYPLLVQIDIELVTKPFKSFLEKTHRRNVLHNKNWPEPPSVGWMLEDNWFTESNDLVRTLIVVKYLDGVEFILKKLETLCEDCILENRKKLEAREDGYYAAHFYITQEFEIPTKIWNTVKLPLKIEIQITTQLQEVIRKLLHTYYAKQRISSSFQDQSWKWDYKSNEFSASYLGHILHYIEGLIVETRERQKN